MGGQDQTTSVDKESRDIAYTTKTTLSQGFLDLALLTSSARKLRDVMELDQWKLNQHVTFGCLILSIILQVTDVFNNKFNLKMQVSSRNCNRMKSHS